MRRATGLAAWSTSSSWMSDVSRAAVLARIVRDAVEALEQLGRARRRPASVSAFTRARSSRTRNAITWNLTRLVGPSLPRWAFASTSRTLRARIGMMGASSSRERVRWRCLVWAMVLPFPRAVPGTPSAPLWWSSPRGAAGMPQGAVRRIPNRAAVSEAHTVGRRTDSSGALPILAGTAPAPGHPCAYRRGDGLSRPRAARSSAGSPPSRAVP